MLNISIPNIYPILFKEYTNKVFPQKPYRLLKQYLKQKSYMILPKHIILESDMGEIYFGPKVTKPKPEQLTKEKLKLQELDNLYIISKMKDDKNGNLIYGNLSKEEANEAVNPEEGLNHAFHENGNLISGNMSEVEANEAVNPEEGLNHAFHGDGNLISGNMYEVEANEAVNPEEGLDQAFHEDGNVIPGNMAQTGNCLPTNEGINIDEALDHAFHEEAMPDNHDSSLPWFNLSLPSFSSGDDPMNNNIFPSSGPSNPDNSNSSYRNPSSGPSDPSDLSSFDSEDENFRNQNIFLHPEKAPDASIQALIHCSKTQFMDHTRLMEPYVARGNTELSKYSQVFIFRLKLAKNWSFGTLAVLFCVSKKTVRRHFWHISSSYYMNHMAIPNILESEDGNEALFEELYQAQDPFYRELYGALKDPKGKHLLNNLSFSWGPV